MRALLIALTLIAVPATAAPQAESGGAAHGIAPPPHGSTPGVLRIWGHPQAEAWLVAQANRLQQRSNLRIDARLTGSDVGMAALYTGQADIVLMGREATESEIKAFEWVYRYRPTAVPLLGGSLDRAGQAPALVAFVHRDNPLESISLAQLDGMFGTARDNGWHDGQPVVSAARGTDLDIRQWGQLGLLGEWAARPIRLYGPMVESGTGRFFRERVLTNSNRMHWDALNEFADPVCGTEDSARAILDALARDRTGIAITNLQFANSGVKPLALIDKGGRPVRATREALVDGAYPLGRIVYAYINKPIGGGIDPQVRLWLLDVLSSQVHTSTSGFLPLPERERQRALDILSAESSKQRQQTRHSP